MQDKDMPRIKEHLRDLYRTVLPKISRYNSLRLDMNENPVGLPQTFINKVIKRLDTNFLATYPEYKKIEEKIANHNNLKLENICLANGSDAAIKYIFDAYVSKGDKILLTEPTFAMYPVYSKMFNAKPVIVEYNPDLTFPKEDFVAKLSSSLKIAVIVNPNNPTGSILTRDEIINITELAAKKDVLIIIDEAYFYFYPRSIIDKIKTYNNLIVLRTFSKLCGMAGLRLGYAAACPEIIRDLRKVKPTFDVNSIAVLFAEELFDNPAVIKTMIEDFNTGRNYLVAKLRREGIDYRMGHANFLLISCGERVDEVIEKMQRKNILVSGGFKQEFLKEYIRVTVGNKAVMEIFWNNFIKIWKGR